MLETSSAPLILSHSSCRAVADHPRNASDDMLRALELLRRHGEEAIVEVLGGSTLALMERVEAVARARRAESER